jgi:heterodisulfide reductase subunit A
VESAKHRNIKLVTNAEVTSVEGEPGNFHVGLLHKPWYVDIERCTGCGACVDVCPVSVPHEWEMNLKPRKAIFSLFPQAAPLKYVIDRDRCIECGLCMQVCGLDAIDLSQEPRESTIDTGAIVVATGAGVFDPSSIPEFGYPAFENIVTNMEFERICNASGPTEGELVRPDGKPIHSVVFIQCVGSRDLGHNVWCSFFCCMASVKGGRLVMEHAPGADVTVFFNDLRACGKGFEELYRRSIDEGMKFIRSIPSIQYDHSTNDPIVVYEDPESGGIVEKEVDLVVLASGMEGSEGTKKIRRVLGLERDTYGFLSEKHPVDGLAETGRAGIFVAGTCQGPKDIPDSATQGSAAAAKVGILLSRGERWLSHENR